jgi:hypothetical protein
MPLEIIGKRDEPKRSLEEWLNLEFETGEKRMHEIREINKRAKEKGFLFGEGKTRLTAADVAELEKELIQE